MNIFINKLKSSNYILYSLVAFVILVSCTYAYILFSYPFQEGGDLLFHTWFANQISNTGDIPQSMPTSDAIGAYTITPLFQIFTSYFSQITGFHIIYATLILNLLLLLLFFGLIYMVSRLLLGKPIVALLSVVLIFFLNNNFNFYYYLPRNFSLLLFLFIVYLLIRMVKYGHFSIGKYALLYALCLSLAFIHLLNAAYAFTIILGITGTMLLFIKQKKQMLFSMMMVVLAVITFFLCNISFFINNEFPIDTSDPSFLTNNATTSSAGYTINITMVVNIIFIIFLLAGLYTLFKRFFKNHIPNYVLLVIISWIFIAFLILYQTAGGFDFLSNRAISFITPPLALITAWGIYIILCKFSNRYGISPLLISSFLIALLVFPLANTLISNDIPQIDQGMARQNIKELINISEQDISGTVLSDPYTMYLLTSIAGMKPVYNFEHTKLVRNEFIEWPQVKNFFSEDPESIYALLQELNPDYIAISAKTHDFMRISNFHYFTNEHGFYKIYQSAYFDEQYFNDSLGTAYPYYTIYEYRK